MEGEDDFGIIGSEGIYEPPPILIDGWDVMIAVTFDV